MKTILIPILSLFLATDVFACISIPQKFTPGIRGLDPHMSLSFQCNQDRSSRLQLDLANNLEMHYELNGNKVCLSVFSYDDWKKVDQKESRYADELLRIKDTSTIQEIQSVYEDKFQDQTIMNVFNGGDKQQIRECLRAFPVPQRVGEEDCAKEDFIITYNALKSITKILSQTMNLELWNQKITGDVYEECKKIYDGTFCDQPDTTYRLINSRVNELNSAHMSGGGMKSISSFYGRYAQHRNHNECTKKVSECYGLLDRVSSRIKTEERRNICSDFENPISLGGKTFKPSDIRDKYGNIVGTISISGNTMTIRPREGSEVMEVQFGDKASVAIKNGDNILGTLSHDTKSICSELGRGGVKSTGSGSAQEPIAGRASELVASNKCGPSLNSKNLPPSYNSPKLVPATTRGGGIR